MFCPECQTELREGVRQCPICGTRQPITLPPPEPTMPQAPPKTLTPYRLIGFLIILLILLIGLFQLQQ